MTSLAFARFRALIGKFHSYFVACCCLAVLLCGGCFGKPSKTPEWNYVFYKADDNGFPLNAPWGYQITPPFTSNCGERKYSPCTDQPQEVNWDWGLCGMWGFDGHYNRRTVAYEGLVCWDSHSGSDDDYNIKIYRPDNAGFEPGARSLLIEFDSDETIDHFHTPWWTSFHHAVDDSDSKAGSMINGKQAIAIGTLGLDCAHSCSPEIHPVMGLAIHVNNNPNDDTWAFFARNWGDEGYCGDFVVEEPQRQFTFRLPWRKGASEVVVSSGNFRCRDATDTWSVDARRAENAVLVTLTIGPFSERDRMNGEIHLQWSGPNVDPDPSPWDWQELWSSWSGDHPAWTRAPDTCMGEPTGPPSSGSGVSWIRDGKIEWRRSSPSSGAHEKEDEPEQVVNEAIKLMTPEQRATLQRLWPRSLQADEAVPQRTSPGPSAGWWGKSSGPPSRMQQHHDAAYIALKVQRIKAIRAALGPALSAKLPLPDPDKIGMEPPPGKSVRPQR